MARPEEQLNNTEIRLGLERMQRLMHLLGDPQDKLRFIHVAGTNGKGSTCSFISAMLTANGYRTGMYTSPAVEDVREQYVIDGDWISSEEYADLAARVCAASVGIVSEIISEEGCPVQEISDTDMMPTAFEYETAMAFLYFCEKGCDYVVLETGLGGEGDATNIIKSAQAVVLTSISEDHLGLIGNNIEEVAGTKAGIIKPGVPVALMDNVEPVMEIVREKAAVNGSELRIMYKRDVIINGDEDGVYFDYKGVKAVRLNTYAKYQAYNAALALLVLRLIKERDETFVFEEGVSLATLGKVLMPYRFQKLYDDPVIIADGAHNPDAAYRLRETIVTVLDGYRLIYIFGMFKDKDYRKVIRIMAPMADMIYTVQTPDSKRALPKEELRKAVLEEVNEMKEENVIDADLETAVKQSIKVAETINASGLRAAIIVFGSLSYLKYIKDYLTDD
ncbi:MAG: bifunctional folylpolyglutamate synthase/dihydrofolate synthase [Lachnospiraceae bacterium]|nr:bifunctional folylpolyglutamate synthase/dihydrofolate synthase [Lachnospiraceae bacterium]